MSDYGWIWYIVSPILGILAFLLIICYSLLIFTPIIFIKECKNRRQYKPNINHLIDITIQNNDNPIKNEIEDIKKMIIQLDKQIEKIELYV